jgi:3-keto-disaccharide hydrolase
MATLRSVKLFIVMLIACAASTARAADDGFVPLFDGKTLDGWEQKGGQAHYAVEQIDGGPAIVGSTVPNTANSFLCTKKHFGDFVLEYEFNCDNGLNSGVQVRSNAYDKEMTFAYGTRSIKVAAGRVHGYQVEIDPDKPQRKWTGGIYEEGRRGWLYPLTGHPKAQDAAKPLTWNKVRVEAVGDRIRTWVNGVPCADLVDSMTQTGFVALQVHGVGGRKEPLHVRWRNMRIKDLGTPTWKPLFNGKDLTGWNPTVEGTWSVKDGVIVGQSSSSEKRHSILMSNDKYKDFTLRVMYKAIKGNSGVYFRVDKSNSGVAVSGFQAEIDPQKDAGGLYETGGRAWVAHPKPEDVKKWYRPDDWNQMTVSAHGRRIVVHVNNMKTAELDNDPGRLEGYLGLQLHGGMDMDVMFKSVEMMEESK